MSAHLSVLLIAWPLAVGAILLLAYFKRRSDRLSRHE